MERESVIALTDRIKAAAEKERAKHHLDSALNLISMCADVEYRTNICYKDGALESMIDSIAKEIPVSESGKRYRRDTVLFWDGFGIDNRGLVQIYLHALCKCRHVVYVSYEDCKEDLQTVRGILAQYSATAVFIHREKREKTKAIQHLCSVIEQYCPGCILHYSTPDDVIGAAMLCKYAGRIRRCIVNLTDHAFWLGTGSLDCSIESRIYGAQISGQFRGIPENKIALIPFYPAIDRNAEFQGYPFPLKKDQMVAFSGGALYKTFGGDGLYYKMAAHILREHENLVFWYAGSGDRSKLLELKKEFPDRVYITAERKDLFQVLRHSRFYFSTYPLCGGLMTQYAAMAGKVPVTLEYDDAGKGLLIDQDALQIVFKDESSLYQEVDRLIRDDRYCAERAAIMERAVISQEAFEAKIRALLDEQWAPIQYHSATAEETDTAAFRERYLRVMSEDDLAMMTARRGMLVCGLRYFPFSTTRGVFVRVKRSIKGRLSRR